MTIYEASGHLGEHCLVRTSLGRRVFGKLQRIDVNRFVVKVHERPAIVLSAHEITDIVDLDGAAD